MITRLGLGSLAALAAALVGCAVDPARDAMTPVRAPKVGRPALEHVYHVVLHDRREDYKPVEFATPAAIERQGVGDRIVIGSHGGELAALEAASGKIAWRRDIGPQSSTPLVDAAAGRIFVGTDEGLMLALDAFDGHEIWRYATKGAIEHAPLLLGADTKTGPLLLFANDADRVYALDPTKGTVRWQYQRETPEEFAVRGHSGVAVANGRAFVGFADGNLVALDLATGDVVWAHSLAGAETKFIDVDATPVIAGDLVIAASVAGGLYALDAASGSERWREPLTGVSGLTLDGPRLYAVAAETGVSALDLSGHVIWRQGMAQAGDPGTPLIDGDALVFTTVNAGLFVIRKRDGVLLQTWNPGAGIGGDPLLWKGRLYLLSNGGIFYAFNLFPEPRR